MAKKLQADGADCVLHVVPGGDHGFDIFAKEGTPLWAERGKALDFMVQRLRQIYEN